MSKYLEFFRLSWSEVLSYRTSFVMWRFRQFLLSFMALSVWAAVYQSNSSAFGYSQAELFSYIFLTTLLQNIILTTALNGLSGFIYSGDLSNLLVKPLNILGYLISRDVADKLFNILFTIGETILLWFIFKPTLIWPNIESLPLFIMSIIFGVVLTFCLQVIFGSIGFWSPDTWGPRFLFYILVDLTSGKLFPLDVLPKAVQTILFLTPFPYFTYAQVQFALGRFTFQEAWHAFGTLTLWMVILISFTFFLWKKGMNQYQAAGQ